jgi:hypothetical protein
MRELALFVTVASRVIACGVPELSHRTVTALTFAEKLSQHTSAVAPADTVKLLLDAVVTADPIVTAAAVASTVTVMD